ncbi:MAG: LON peptidase substrate-binding domain-containing protein [Actinomycetota bacterium]
MLFPHAVLPLHVFEPRYRALVQRCLAQDPEFGVVLIERGSEVGGGDTRFAVGTVARIVQGAELPDGRYVLVTVGGERMRVTEWLADDPYPRALVEPVDDLSTASNDAPSLRDRVHRELVRVLALRAELGEPGRVDDLARVELDADPARASFEAAALAPLTPLDAQRVLEVDDVAVRLERLHTLLVDEAAVLEQRLAAG